MTKKDGILISLGLTIGMVGSILFTLFIIWVLTLQFYNPFLAPKLVKHYSDDSNYYVFEAVIFDLYEDSPESGYLRISSVVYKESGEPIAIPPLDSYLAKVFSPNTEETWSRFAPEIGSKFQFIGSPKVIYVQCPIAIVSLTIEDEEILSFEDGKSAVIEWAKHVH